ncbi:MAG: transaldolase family protein [Nanoarchaeota archaeon]
MKIFLDSADIDEIKQFYEWGIADGITTNPSLLKKAVARHKGLDMKGYLTEILTIAKGTPVSLEVTEISAEGMIAEGKKLYKMFNPVAGNVVIKIPVNSATKEDDKEQFAGIEAIKALAGEGIPINCTLIFTPEQALLAAKAGAAYVSPFAGRVDDLLRSNAKIKFEKTDYFDMDGIDKNGEGLDDQGIVSGVDLVAECVDIIEHYGYKTEVLAASLRNPRQVRECALVGAHVATLPFDVVKDMLKHEKTFEGMRNFMKDVVKEYAELK